MPLAVTPVAPPAPARPAGCASRGRVFNSTEPGGLDPPARRPGRLGPAARARADRLGRRGRGRAPARAGRRTCAARSTPARPSPARWRARRASSTTSTAPSSPPASRAARSAACSSAWPTTSRSARRCKRQADRRDAVPGDRLADRDRHRDLPRHLRRAAGGDGVHQHQARAAVPHRGDAGDQRLRAQLGLAAAARRSPAASARCCWRCATSRSASASTPAGSTCR